ncbi:MAG: LysM peptidoglycan-binding domain-containing protein [Puniceicoccales bacterium]|jgi:LysM repeat protein|nr:LysM peptidoglycan-binding domain-containing protein [Puniceicoccales bacterium]
MVALAQAGRLCLILPLLAIAGVLAACNPDIPRDGEEKIRPETEDPAFKEAIRIRKSHPDKALQLFLRVIRERARFNGPESLTPQSHLNAGEIYLNRQNGIYAAYHFKEYGRTAPSPAEKRASEIKIRQTQPLLSRRGIPNGGVNQEDYQRLMERCRELELVDARLREAIRRLESEKRALAAAGAGVWAGPATVANAGSKTPTPVAPSPSRGQVLPQEAFNPALPPPPIPGRAVPIPATYTVVKGDTLFRISAKVYGNGSHFPKIIEANRDKLKNRNTRLQEGWVLRIPRL